MWSWHRHVVVSDKHNNDVIMGAIASQITSLTIVFSTVYLDTDQRKHQCSASLAFVRGIHRRPVNSPHKWPVTRKMFPFDDVIMVFICSSQRDTYFHFIIFFLLAPFCAPSPICLSYINKIIYNEKELPSSPREIATSYLLRETELPPSP